MRRGPVHARLMSTHSDSVAAVLPPAAPVDLPPRRLFAVGRVKDNEIQCATRCGWCDVWMSAEDFALHLLGAKTSHGICPACEAKHFPNDAA